MVASTRDSSNLKMNLETSKSIPKFGEGEISASSLAKKKQKSEMEKALHESKKLYKK